MADRAEKNMMRQTTATLSFFSTGQTAVKLSGAEAADWAQCAAPD